jgi:hypothetical protein
MSFPRVHLNFRFAGKEEEGKRERERERERNVSSQQFKFARNTILTKL